MNSKKVHFKNKQQQELSGYLELPLNREPHNFVLFAHCFTCNKNYFAVKNISNALTLKGFGVLRFDFTGLGESEGDFEESTFSGNVADLIAAAEYLQDSYKAPTLLIGHSLGGAAVLIAANQIPSVVAIATIAAPASLEHVKNLFKNELKTINDDGSAEVTIGNQKFNLKKQFIEDLNEHSLLEKVSELKKPLLFLHSPQDKIVGIDNAEALYKAAHHPKSFISLDGANHLLTVTKDSNYAGEVIGSWAYRYLEIPAPKKLKSSHEVIAVLGKSGFTTQIKAGDHLLVADEPESIGGNNFGPSPYDLVSAGLAACTSMTLQMYAKRKGWKLEQVETHVDYGKDYAEDCERCEENGAKIDTFKRELQITGDLDEKQLDKLIQIADKCPVHKTLHTQTQVITSLKKNEQ